MQVIMENELIKRYQYLCDNANFILAPFMYEQTREERKRLNAEYHFLGLNIFITDECAIYLQKLPHELLLSLESFLMFDGRMEENAFYLRLETDKNNPDYLVKVQQGNFLLDKKNQRFEKFDDKLDIWKLLNLVKDFVNNQSADLKNKKKKLKVLHEYFRLCCILDKRQMPEKVKKVTPNREEWDIGVENNDFINYYSLNANLSQYHNLDVILQNLSHEKKLIKQK